MREETGCSEPREALCVPVTRAWGQKCTQRKAFRALVRLYHHGWGWLFNESFSFPSPHRRAILKSIFGYISNDIVVTKIQMRSHKRERQGGTDRSLPGLGPSLMPGTLSDSGPTPGPGGVGSACVALGDESPCSTSPGSGFAAAGLSGARVGALAQGPCVRTRPCGVGRGHLTTGKYPRVTRPAELSCAGRRWEPLRRSVRGLVGSCVR